MNTENTKAHMKKRIITMNLGGFVFHIEEDAHEKLNNYLQHLKGCLPSLPGWEEIIETRIAEMLQVKVNAGKKLFVLTDIDSFINRPIGKYPGYYSFK